MIMKEKTVKMSQIALFSAVATLLMFFEFPILFLPQFYKMDFSEVVTLISGFMLGPISGVIVELLKNILKILFKGTSTAGVGELSNFLIGCSFVLPSSIFYKRNRTKKNAVISLLIGTASMIIFSIFINLIIMLPLYSKVLSVDLSEIVGENIFYYAVFAIVPFNFIKAALSSFICFFIYKKVRLSFDIFKN